jgi:hypothetical protein
MSKVTDMLVIMVSLHCTCRVWGESYLNDLAPAHIVSFFGTRFSVVEIEYDEESFERACAIFVRCWGCGEGGGILASEMDCAI